MQRPPRPKYLSLIVIFAAQLFLFSPFHLTAAPQTSDESKLLQAREKGKRQSAYLAGKSESIEKPKLKANLSQFKKQIQPLLVKACTQCHGPEEQEGNIRIDTLDPNLFEGKDVQWWLEVFAVVSNSEMPPPEEKLLSEPERVQIINWLKNELKHASEARQSQKASTSFRRMTNYEFNYALQDLLGLPFDFARDLPKKSCSPGVLKTVLVRYDYRSRSWKTFAASPERHWTARSLLVNDHRLCSGHCPFKSLQK